MKLSGPSGVLPAGNAGPSSGSVDDARFEAFVRAHQDMVFATAVRLLGRAADAEDVAQDVFLRAYQHFGALAESPTASGWLRTVARNAALNHLTRYRSRWRLFSELARDEDEDEAIGAGRHAGVLPAVSTKGDETRALETALRRLPQAHRVPLVLHHFEELSYQDIADLLGVSLGKVKTDIHRGREALKAILIPHGTR